MDVNRYIELDHVWTVGIYYYEVDLNLFRLSCMYVLEEKMWM